MSLIGLLTTAEKQIHLDRLHMRPIQWHLIYNGGCKRTMALQANHYTYKTCSANLYRRIKRRVGCSPKRMHCKRHLVPSGKQVAYQLPRTQGSLSSLITVPRPMHTQDSTCSDGQHHSGVIHKQGRRHEVGPTLCSTMKNLDLVTRNQVTLKARHIPSRLM